jgi:5-methylcytosine-specific restriction endonuclease McrA
MPIDYNNYPPNWKTEIRPAIMQRANSKCEFCGVLNYKFIIRGVLNGDDCYQDDDGIIYDANNSKVIGSDILGEIHPTNKMIKVVLTIAHLNHDVTDNRHENLKALCQRCHNLYDAAYRKENRSKTIQNKKGLQSLF